MDTGSKFLHKRVFTVIFIILLFGFSCFNLLRNGPILGQTVRSAAGKLRSGTLSPTQAVAAVDDALTVNLLGRMEFIEGYSYLQKVLDKREVGNFAYIQDETGSLHYATFFREDDPNCFEYALRVKRMQDYVSQFGTKVLFVVPPSKYTSSQTPLRSGLPANNPQNIVNEMMFYLNRMGVETLDLGNYVPNEELSFEEVFFKTDHHWTIPAAFYSTRILAQTIQDRFGIFMDTERYLAPEAFTEVTYYGGMLGSMGRKTGACFSGVDDFTALYPKFEVNFFRRTLEENGTYLPRNGGILGTLVLPDVLRTERSIYSDSQYSLYLNGLRTYESIVNMSSRSGPSIFMIRDSYFSPVISFLAPMCSRIDAMWSLEDRPELDIESYVKEHNFDLIIVEMYPYNISGDAFQFFGGDAA